MVDKRTVLNAGLLGLEHYAFVEIKHTSPMIPASSDEPGPYVFRWDGTDTVQTYQTGTWTVDDNLSGPYTMPDFDRWSATDGYIVASTSGGDKVFTGIYPRFLGSGGTNLRVYRLEDEADFLAGRVFRRKFMAPLVALNPSCIRFMDWTGGNDSHMTRWEYRKIPTSSRTWGFGADFLSYGTTTGTNQFSLLGVAGTPAAMVHGEVVQCAIGNTVVRSLRVEIQSITKANPGVVTTKTAHGFNTGDKIIHYNASNGNGTIGMNELIRQMVTITVLDSTSYSIGIDTTGYGTFSAGGHFICASQYVTLNVGGRGDYPIIWSNGYVPAGHYGGTLSAGQVRAFYFDKQLKASTEVDGAWIFKVTEFHNSPPVPIEICVQFIRELNEDIDAWNAANPSARQKGPVHMWANVGHLGLLSTDPDYDAGSNAAIGLVDVCLNGANGYQGLPAKCNLFVEHSNETWNNGGDAFAQVPCLSRKGGIQYGYTNADDVNSYSTVRAVTMANDIRAAFPGNARIKLVLAGQGANGLIANNQSRLYGNALIDNDATFIAAGGGDPIDYFDHFAWTCYWNFTEPFFTNNLATSAAAWAAATTDEEREAIFAAFVIGIIGEGTGETISRYTDSLLPDYAGALLAKAKTAINYEGGWNTEISGYEGATFINAVKRSQAWADAIRLYLDACSTTDGMEMPCASYVQYDTFPASNGTWGHGNPGPFLNGVEGGALDLSWNEEAEYNNQFGAVVRAFVVPLRFMCH